MIRAIVIEDERPAQEHLLATFRETGHPIEVMAVLGSVEEAIDYFRRGTTADIIFSDVQLGDGVSFQVFREVGMKVPVVFITAYDRFMLEAFEHNGIDYLLKPVTKSDLNKALLKYQMLEKHFSAVQEGALEKLISSLGPRNKSRLPVRKGLETLLLRLSDIVLFYLENKIVYVVDRDGRKYLCEKSLTDLEHELDGDAFMRVNRQYILNADYIKSYRLYERVKLQVELTLPHLKHFIVVSQDMAPVFKRWVEDR